MIKIIDCGSQLTQNIARRVRELGVFTEIVPFNSSKKIISNDLEGIIISGGQFSVYDENSPMFQKSLLFCGKPVLGICYGQQAIAHLLGGKVSPTEKREYGEKEIIIKEESSLFKGISEKEFNVWMSHGDIVEKIPENFKILAKSNDGHIAAMQRDNIYSVQFHPEVDDTKNGKKILNNFLDICNAKRNWDPQKDYDRIIEETTEKIFGKIGIGGISGGVDSTSASVLIKNIAGENYHPIFIDNGLLRLNEAEEVKKSLSPLNLNVKFINAEERFLTKLEDVVNPDKKREIIGNEFYYIFEEEAKKINEVSYFVQGTLYPDVIESIPIYGASSKIKRHHNVGGLPEKIGLEVVEPFRNLFKDEVRKIAKNKLNIPDEIIWRHPFPGPGLAIRIVGQAVTKEKLNPLKKADEIFIEELKRRNLYNKISQAFPGLFNFQSTGVMGDEGTYQGTIGLRTVVTKDFMTSNIYRFDWDVLQEITNRIINEVKGINRVFYDTSQKPPSTIEWE